MQQQWINRKKISQQKKRVKRTWSKPARIMKQLNDEGENWEKDLKRQQKNQVKPG
jgi:hypothetical protein